MLLVVVVLFLLISMTDSHSQKINRYIDENGMVSVEVEEDIYINGIKYKDISQTWYSRDFNGANVPLEYFPNPVFTAVDKNTIKINGVLHIKLDGNWVKKE